MTVGIFGIVNITEDSFSDGGRFLATDAAIAHARKLVRDGADVIDLGAAASNPNAIAVPPKEEILRLAPVVAALKSDGIKVSIDTFARETQEWALTQGVDYVNDIAGFSDASLYPALAKSRAQLVVMHKVGGAGRAVRVDTDPNTIVADIEAFFAARFDALIRAGVPKERLILDPGMGIFLGADPSVSLTVLRAIPRLKRHFGTRILISVSRKGFLRRLTRRPVAEIGPATLAAELYAASQGVDFLRTHDVAALKDALGIWAACTLQ